MYFRICIYIYRERERERERDREREREREIEVPDMLHIPPEALSGDAKDLGLWREGGIM